MGGQLVQIVGGAEQEDAAVPHKVAVGHVGLGGFQVRLLDEAVHRMHVVVPLQRRAAADVAVARLRPVGADAEGEQRVPLSGGHRRGLDRRGEGGFVADQMVGRHHEQKRLRVALQREAGGKGNGRGSVAPLRLEDDGLGRAAALAQLLSDDEAVLLVGHQQGRAVPRPVHDPADRRLKHGAGIDQRQQLLRIQGAGQRPQPRARAAGEDDGPDRLVGGHIDFPSVDAPGP